MTTLLRFTEDDRGLLDRFEKTHIGLTTGVVSYAAPLPFLAVLQVPPSAKPIRLGDLVGHTFYASVDRSVYMPFGPRPEVKFVPQTRIYLSAENERSGLQAPSLTEILASAASLDLSCLCDLPEAEAEPLRQLAY